MRASTRWCDACAQELAVRPDEPHLISPRVDPGVPVFSLGRYAGARREAIVAVKEHGRADLVDAARRRAARRAGPAADLGRRRHPLTVVARTDPPMGRQAPRRRPGHARWPWPRRREIADVNVVQALRTRALVADSVGLSSADRQRNIAGRVKVVRPVAGEVLVVDDIVTTGATARESVRVLQTAGRGGGGGAGGRERLTRGSDGPGNYPDIKAM